MTLDYDTDPPHKLIFMYYFKHAGYDTAVIVNSEYAAMLGKSRLILQ
jgi:hypothetical protein